MHRFGFLLLGFILAQGMSVSAQTQFQPTTTLKLETSNNTSAADSFGSQSNGNSAAANISKVPIRTLLYHGASTKLYAHWVPWFGLGTHVDVGYSSGDAVQIQKQVTDMISRGLDGVIIDWYGRGASHHEFVSEDLNTQTIMREAELHPGFTFAIMADSGALKYCSGGTSCDPTDNLINDLNYAYRTYESSPAYLRYNGRPVVLFFGQSHYAIDWIKVRARVAGNPLLIFRNAGAFGHTEADGGFAWETPAGAVGALDHLSHYYVSALHHSDAFSLGAAYKGFDDSIALWGSHRYVGQECGQTWLQSLAAAGQYYSADQQLDAVQLVTWNDYEEGSEIETGIDNCVAISALGEGSILSWKISGDKTTLDHYTVFISRDGSNLMPLADLAPESTSLDLTRFALPGGEYTAFVKAVGRASMANKMSEGRRVTIGAQPVTGPRLQLSVMPETGTGPLVVEVSLQQGQVPSGSSTVIDFGDGSLTFGQPVATHTYSLPGTYAVMAMLTDSAGNSATHIAFVQVGAEASNHL